MTALGRAPAHPSRLHGCKEAAALACSWPDFPAWQPRMMQQLPPLQPGLGVGAGGSGEEGAPKGISAEGWGVCRVWGAAGNALRASTSQAGVRGRWPAVRAGSRLAFLFVSLLLLVFVVFLPLEFLPSEFLDDDVLLAGRESRAR